MKIIRWLFSHIILILLIVIVIYAYMFWGNLLGKDTPAGKTLAYLSDEFVEVREFVDAVKTKQAQLSEGRGLSEAAGSGEAVSDTNPVDTAESGETAVQNEADAPQQAVSTKEVAVSGQSLDQRLERYNPEQGDSSNKPDMQASSVPAASGGTPVATSQQANLAAPSDIQTGGEHRFAGSGDPASAVSAEDMTAASATVDDGKHDSYVPAEVEQKLNEPDTQGTNVEISHPTGEIREKWITARKAFYQRNYELSEASYKQVIDSSSNNFDAYGELGNVYFNQGKHKEAAAAYFEAATILVDKGQIYRAKSLIGLLRHLDSSKADELQKIIDGAGT